MNTNEAVNEFISEQASAPADNNQQPSIWTESRTEESSPTEASLHLSTSLMAQMRLGEPEDPAMDASLQHDPSLMDCSEVPQEMSACPGAPPVDTEDIDPFSEARKAHLLDSLPRHLSDYDGYAECDYPMPELVLTETVGLSKSLP